MKKYLTAALIIMLFAGQALAAQPAKVKEVKKATVETLMQGLKSDNYGLKVSSAYMLGELSCEKATLPLMHILRTSNNEDERIIAALALYKIGNPVGMNIVKKAVMFDESDRVKKHCNDFYNQYVKNNQADAKTYFALN